MSEVAAFTPPEHDLFERPTSSKAAARAARRAARNAKVEGQTVKPLVPKNETQRDYIECLDQGESVIAIGPAGTGKTYIPARRAARGLVEGKFEKIIVSRVTASKREHAIGFLPGNIDAKMKPWLTPVIEGIRAEVSAKTFDTWKGEGRFEIVPFEYMRGRTFENAFVILDEGQNATFEDLTLFLTRTGEGSQVVVAGDLDQIDIPNSGLSDIVDLAEQFEIMDVVEFSEDDVVRSALAKAWVKAIAARRREQEAQRAAANEQAARDSSFGGSAPQFIRNT